MLKGPAYVDVSNNVPPRDIARERIKRYAPHTADGATPARAAPAALLRWASGRPAGESNDCAVRALSNVSELTYEEAHALLATRCNRQCGKGPAAGLYMDLLDSLAPRVQTRAKTFCAFIRENPRGVYLVWIRGHAVALIDGALIDTGYCGKRVRFVGAWKFAD